MVAIVHYYSELRFGFGKAWRVCVVLCIRNVADGDGGKV